MRKSLRFAFLSMFFMLCAGVSAQTVVTIDFDTDYQTLFPTLPGVSDGNGSSDGDFTENTTSTAVDGVTVTVTATESGTKNRIWTSAPRLRMYNGTFTVTGKGITKIDFTGHSTNFNLSTTTGTLEGKTWVGQADEIEFAVAKNTQINKIVVTLGGEVINPDDIAKTLYTEAFTANEGSFTIDNKVMPEDLTYVWKFNSYGAVASAFANSTSYETESWLVSPVIDLTKATETSLEFTHALNKFSTIEAAKEQATVLVKVGDGEWAPLEGVVYPEEMGWTFIENSIDVSKLFDGKKVQVAFRYTSNSESAGTWEIKPFTVKGKGEATIEAVEQPATQFPSIEALILAGNTQNIELTLSGAQVIFNDGNYIYLRQQGKAICLYQMPQDIKDDLKEASELGGTIRGDYEVYKNMPEMKANKYTDIKSYGRDWSELYEVMPTQATLAEVKGGAHVCDLVTLTATLVKDVKLKEDGTVQSTTYYLQDDDDNEVLVVNNGKNLNKLEEGEVIVVTAVVNTSSNGDYQLKLTKNAESTSGIASVAAGSSKQAPVYNLAGQRVAAAKSGLYVRNGKKYVVK